MRWAALVAIAAALCGCRIFGAPLSCDGDAQCPSSLRCVDNLCDEPGEGDACAGAEDALCVTPDHFSAQVGEILCPPPGCTSTLPVEVGPGEFVPGLYVDGFTPCEDRPNPKLTCEYDAPAVVQGLSYETSSSESRVVALEGAVKTLDIDVGDDVDWVLLSSGGPVVYLGADGADGPLVEVDPGELVLLKVVDDDVERAIAFSDGPPSANNTSVRQIGEVGGALVIAGPFRGVLSLGGGCPDLFAPGSFDDVYVAVLEPATLACLEVLQFSTAGVDDGTTHATLTGIVEESDAVILAIQTPDELFAVDVDNPTTRTSISVAADGNVSLVRVEVVGEAGGPARGADIRFGGTGLFRVGAMAQSAGEVLLCAEVRSGRLVTNAPEDPNGEIDHQGGRQLLYYRVNATDFSIVEYGITTGPGAPVCRGISQLDGENVAIGGEYNGSNVDFRGAPLLPLAEAGIFAVAIRASSGAVWSRVFPAELDAIGELTRVRVLRKIGPDLIMGHSVGPTAQARAALLPLALSSDLVDASVIYALEPSTGTMRWGRVLAITGPLRVDNGPNRTEFMIAATARETGEFVLSLDDLSNP